MRVVSPAPIGDVLDLYTVEGVAKPLAIKAAILQTARSETIGFYIPDNGGFTIVACALLYPRSPQLRELVFACRPAASQHMLAIIHTARLTRARLAQDGLTIRATVREGHEPGRRLARLCGLAPAGTIGGFERWEWSAEGT